jgi:gliding motility-associated-like protein
MYSITVTNPSNGCTVQDIISVVQLNNPQVSFGVNPASGIAPLPVIFSNSSDTLFTSYSWIFGDGGFSSASNPQHIYNQDGVYQVQLIGLTPNNTCNDTATITITVIPEIEINVPNIFTPNGDNVNEVFLINTVGLKELHVDIFDRWGLKVGEINGINGIWDGYENSEGTYYYILTAKGYDDLIINKNGYFMLVR